LGSPRAFAEICESVRLPLDTTSRAPQAPDDRLADFLAVQRSEALLVSSRTAPGIDRVAEQVKERLELVQAPEVYIRADSELNAFAPSLAHLDRPVAILNSGLVQLLSPAELAFPLGHELGHVGLGHAHAPPVVSQNQLAALRGRSNQRYAEISADRVGLLATRSTFVAASVMIKTASGLPSEVLGFDLEAFVAQMDRSPDEISRDWELEMSHPSLPFRLWAILRFSHSDAYARITGQGGATIPLAAVDAEIAERLASMGDGRLQTLEQEMLERALTWVAAARIMRSTGDIKKYRSVLRELVGEHRAASVTRFAIEHGADAVAAKADTAERSLESSSPTTRERFARDMKRLADDLSRTSRDTT